MSEQTTEAAAGESPRGILLRLVQQHPDATAEEMTQLMIDEVRNNDALLHQIIAECLDTALTSWLKKPG
jgi:hypothetical protein